MAGVTAWAVALLVASGTYLGFQATVRFVVYPQFSRVPLAAFAEYERAHQRAIPPLVGVLFVADGVACIGAFAAGPRLPAMVAGLCLAGTLLLTALGAVPQHRVLSGGFDRAAWRRLLAVDSARLGVAAVAVGAAVWYASG